ncbi:peptidylprolyl isomerase [Candidatus Vesicomyidisocius sp. SY067_SCS001]|uniref:peptidylprolyl isomerase n=1 Tax=Candidatus Vesicomyidisocius sp. SY067_SCS001 TaxID=2732590 RepID=UPI00168575F9|nr:peptidylprolyl isomerase [Candidatus Vesicomyosocius sp. SY067_SCS001]
MTIFETNMGNIHINVDTKNTPISTQNFINYVNNGFYDGTIFHRVIKNFMIQGGGFTKDMIQKTTKTNIKNEAKNSSKNNKYSLAMARTSTPHSANSQFFINTSKNSYLNFPGQDGWGYCVFGKVVKGFEVIDKINQVSTSNKSGHSDVPNDYVVVNKAYNA